MRVDPESLARNRRLTAARPHLSPDLILDPEPEPTLPEEDALWETLPETIPLDPKIIALFEDLLDDETT